MGITEKLARFAVETPFTAMMKHGLPAPSKGSTLGYSNFNQTEIKLSSHSKMVETRRRKQKDKKRVARVSKEAEKLKKQNAKGTSASAAKQQNP